MFDRSHFIKRPSLRGYTLIEMLIGISITLIVLGGVTTLLVRMQRQALAARAHQAAASEANTLMTSFRKVFMTKTGGNDSLCSTPGTLAAPGIGAPSYCIANCVDATKKASCRDIVIRRGSLDDYEDVRFESRCIAAPTGISKRLNGRTMNSSCNVGCSGTEMPIVAVTRKHIVSAVQTSTGTRMFPPKGITEGLSKGASAFDSIGAEICISVDDVAFDPGVLTVNARSYNFGTGESLTDQTIQATDATATIDEQSIMAPEIIFLPSP